MEVVMIYGFCCFGVTWLGKARGVEVLRRGVEALRCGKGVSISETDYFLQSIAAP
jgi:hypothetical protein